MMSGLLGSPHRVMRELSVRSSGTLFFPLPSTLAFLLFAFL